MMNKQLNREVFITSRTLEYFTEKELRAQIGHDKKHWPISILKELIDNSLDACEMSGIAPVIEVAVENDFITITDNGPGIPDHIIEQSLDFSVRVSDKAYYVSPTRGQMGNALKTVYAAPFVQSGEGFVEIAANGKLHRIEVSLDRIAQEPKITHTVEDHFIKNGTFIKIHYPFSSSLLLTKDDDKYNPPRLLANALINRYSAFNPHATFICNGKRYEATNIDWKKWQPNMPTSPHWYDEETLRDLISGYLRRERLNGHHKTVREFVSEFRGLSGISKQKKVTTTYGRSYLKDFVKDGDIDQDFISNILSIMQEETNPVKPQLLGILGKEHLTNWMLKNGISVNTIKYTQKAGYDDGLPYILEIAFGVKKNANSKRNIINGLNWSPTIGEEVDPLINWKISEARVDRIDPVILIIHIAKPRFEFMDRGKTKIEL